MVEYAYGYDEVVGNWTAALIPSCAERGIAGAYKAIGVVEGENLVAGVIYHNWQPEAGVIEMSFGALSGKQWLTRETIRRIFEFPFEQLGCQMVIGLVDAEDERTLRQAAIFGCSLIRIPRLLGREHDAVLATLTVEEWQSNKIHKRSRSKKTNELELEEAA